MQGKLKKIVKLISEGLISKGLKDCAISAELEIYKNEYNGKENLLLITQAIEETKILLDIPNSSVLKMASAIKGEECSECNADSADLLKKYFNTLLGIPKADSINTYFLGGKNLKYYPSQEECCLNIELSSEKHYLMNLVVIAPEGKM